MKDKCYNNFAYLFFFILLFLIFPYYNIAQITTVTLTTASASPFSVPAGVTTLTVECWGGGGGGGFGRSNTGASGGGGGGGAYTINTAVAVVGGSTVPFTVDPGGNGGTSGGGAATSGGTTTFSSGVPVAANGGIHGTDEAVNASGAGGAGGAGGTFSGGAGSIGQGNIGGGGGGGSAGQGSNGNTAITTITGAAAVAGGGGGGNGASNSNGAVGNVPGGGGAGGNRNGSSRGGGNGGAGQIVITYCVGPIILAQPISEIIYYSGSNTYFHANISGPVGLTYQWQRSTNGGGTWANISSAGLDVGTTYSDFTASTLFLAGVTPSVSGYQYRCIVTGVCASITTDGLATLTVSAPQLCADQYSRPITINKTMVGGGANLTDFPALIDVTNAFLRSTGNGGHVSSANGYDIIFTDVNGTPLNFQTESYNAVTGHYIGWVNIPTLSFSANTIINMYYGNAAVVTDQSSPITWDTNYVGVYHLNSITASTTADGTVDALTGSTNGCATNAGQIANGIKSYSFIQAQGNASSVYNVITQNITVSAWVNFATAGLDQKIVGTEDNVPGGGGWKFGVFTGNNVEFEIRTAADAPFLDRVGQANLVGGPATNLTTGAWHYVVGQYNQAAGTIRTFVGGTAGFTAGSADFGQNVVGVMGLSTATLAIGCEAYNSASNNWSGTLDEIRISKIIRPIGWLQTEYNNQSTPAAYLTLGAEVGFDIWTGTNNWSVAGNWSAGIPVAASDIAVSTGNLTVNSNVQVNSVTVKTGATLTIGAGNTLSVSTFVSNCGTITGGGTLVMNGTTTTNQNISGAGTYSIGGFTINNTTAGTPSVTLQSPVNISGALTLTRGLLNTDAINILTMRNGSTAPALAASPTPASYVNGPMMYQKTTAGATTLNFPIGKSPDCRPLALTVNHVDVTQYNYTAQSFNANPDPGNAFTMAPTTDTVSGVHYWTIDRTSNVGASQPSNGLVGNQIIKINFGTNDFVYQATNLTIVKNTNIAPTSWFDIGATTLNAAGGAWVNSGAPQAGSATSTSAPNTFTSFSTFTLGSLATGWNSLPIKLLDFSATPNSTKVDVKWTTATEVNNNFFTVERSGDGQKFTEVTTVNSKAPKGNSILKLDYQITDSKPLSGTSYYRLKQTDNNGKFEYFNVVNVGFTTTKAITFTVYPNPNSGQFIADFTGIENNHEVQILMHDEHGKLVYSTSFYAQESSSSVNIIPEQKIGKGIYFCSLIVEGIKHTVKVAVE